VGYQLVPGLVQMLIIRGVPGWLDFGYSGVPEWFVFDNLGLPELFNFDYSGGTRMVQY
jgi:hypothetical protein